MEVTLTPQAEEALRPTTRVLGRPPAEEIVEEALTELGRRVAAHHAPHIPAQHLRAEWYTAPKPRYNRTPSGGVPCDYATAASPFFSTSDSSLSEAPEGRFSPRSHLLTRLVVTFR